MRPAARLLLVEAEALDGVLGRHPPEHLDRPSVLPGWRVRDVMAHCGAALGHLVAGDELVFTPEANQIDVDERGLWPVEEVIEELLGRYRPAAEIIDQADGLADGLALGEWVHGGDIRDPLGESDAYASAGVDLAVPLLVERWEQRQAPTLTVALAGREMRAGAGAVVGHLVCDTATFVRLCANRSPRGFELDGVDPAQVVLFS